MALVPRLTQGLPTSTTAAIILSGFQQCGIWPGPLLFRIQADLVWGAIAGAPSHHPSTVPYAGIVILATSGVRHAQLVVRSSAIVDLGVLGFVLRRWFF